MPDNDGIGGNGRAKNLTRVIIGGLAVIGGLIVVGGGIALFLSTLFG